MNFKGQLEKDLAVFINLEEFADLHSVNGCQIPAIINTSTFEDVDRSTGQAIFTTAMRVCLKQGTLSPLPTVNEEVELDGHYYNCLALEVKQGCDVLVIEAHAHR